MVFDDMIMGLQQVMGKQTYDEVKVNKISFGIQNHNFPLKTIIFPLTLSKNPQLGELGKSRRYALLMMMELITKILYAYILLWTFRNVSRQCLE